MTKLKSGIIVTIALTFLMVLLLVFLLSTSLLVIRKKRPLCFSQDHGVRPFLLTNTMRDGDWKKKSMLPPFRKKDKKRKRKAKGNKNQSYPSLIRPSKFPRRDPFASIFLENPMVDMDDFDLDWTNLVFDNESAQNNDAAIKIQPWYRMIRYITNYV